MTGLASISPNVDQRWHKPEITGVLGQVHAAIGELRRTNIFPPAAEIMRSNALVGTIHYSNLIEGNTLSKLEAVRAAEATLDSETKMKIELINYAEALQLIDRTLAANPTQSVLSADFLKSIHRTLMVGIGSEVDPHFKPHHRGEWRDGITTIGLSDGGREVIGASPDEIGPRVDGLLAWAQGKISADTWDQIVITGFVHHHLVEIHPFADGNGRTVRLLQWALLRQLGLMPGNFISLERYYAEDRNAYKDALHAADSPMPNSDVWIKYFAEGFLEEARSAIRDINDLEDLFGGSKHLQGVQLTARQAKGLTVLGDRSSFTAEEYRNAAEASRDQGVRDLRTLIKSGVLIRTGNTAAARYRYTGKRDPRGVKLNYTDEKIEAAMLTFLTGRTSWPKHEDFVAAELTGVYQAMSRSHGIKWWRGKFGY